MFGRGLESLLRQENDLELVGQESDEKKAFEQIKALQPHVVIWDSYEAPDGSVSVIDRILKENPGIRVVGLSLHDNNLYVYHLTQRVVKGFEEFVEAIRFSSPPLLDDSRSGVDRGGDIGQIRH
jgi:DNA-binding NarL/FixJ family response regulator